MKKILAGPIALVVLVFSAASANAQSIDVNMAGWQTWGGFTNPLNSFENINVGVDSQITAVEFFDLQFEAINGSWQSEFIMSVEESTGFPFWDWRAASGINSPGVFGPVSGDFVNGPGVSAGGGPFTSASGILRVYAYESFDDGGAAVQDAQVASGIMRIHFTAVPEPTSLMLTSLGLGLVGLATGRRRRK